MPKQQFKFTKADKLNWQKLADTIKIKNPSAQNDEDFFGKQEKHTEKPKTNPKPKTSTTQQLKPKIIKQLPKLKLGDINDVPASIRKKFYQDNPQLEKTIDLHGYTKNQALDVLQTQIPQCRKQGIRTMQIITGKGQGILQQSLPDFVNHKDLRHHIIAIMQAPKNEGAFYLYLKTLP